MLSEILETLFKSPQKLKKAILMSIKLLLSAITASWVYMKILGTYSIIKLTDLNQWAEFLITGRAIICLILLWVCHEVLFGLLNSLSFIVFEFFYRRILKVRGLYKAIGWFITRSIKSLNALEIDRKSGEVHLLQNSEELYASIKFIQSKKGKAAISDFRHSYLNEIGHTFIVFTLLYFLKITTLPHNAAINYIILILLLGLLYLCSVAGVIVKIIQDISPELTDMIHFARIEKAIKETFEENTWHIHKRTFAENKDQWCFYFNNKYILLKFLNSRNFVFPNDIEETIKDAKVNNTIVLAFSNKPIYKSVVDDVENYKEYLIFTQVNTVKEAKIKSLELIEKYAMIIPDFLFENITRTKVDE